MLLLQQMIQHLKGLRAQHTHGHWKKEKFKTKTDRHWVREHVGDEGNTQHHPHAKISTPIRW